VSGPLLTVTPSGAAQAYARSAAGSSTESGFGATLARALEGVVETGRQADTQSLAALNGSGNFTEVATAVSRAELALQSAVAIRDKVVQAYQDVMRMPI
jgi:flagellar hook-basal body complex protein FliE